MGCGGGPYPCGAGGGGACMGCGGGGGATALAGAIAAQGESGIGALSPVEKAAGPFAGGGGAA